MKRPSASVVFWLLAYGLMVVAIVASLGRARDWATAELARPEALAEWQAWKALATERAADEAGPVLRRPPKSEEPPLLVILRDHFVAALVSCLLLGSALFVFLAIVMHGSRRKTVPPSSG